MEILTFLQVLLIFLFTTIFIYLYHKMTYWNRLGIPNTGFLAQFSDFKNNTNPKDVEIRRTKSFGWVYGTYRFLRPILVVGGLDHVSKILVEDFSNFRNHSHVHFIERRMNLNVFALRDNYWKRMRGIISPFFAPAKLRQLSKSILPCIDQFLINMKQLESQEEVSSMKKYFDCLTMDIIVSCAYGVKIDCLNDPTNEIVMRAGQIFTAVGGSFGIFGAKFTDVSCFEYISQLNLKLIAQRHSENQVDPSSRRSDFLQAMTDAKYAERGPLLTDDEICAFGISFFSDGFDTTSNALTALAYYFATHEEMEKKLLVELKTLGGHDDADEMMDLEKLSNLPYLDGVVKEVLRLWPVAYRNDRLAEKDYRLEGTPWTIPAGTSIEIPVYAMHTDPSIFSSPFEFKPERYLAGGENENFNPLSILTFGAGPKACVSSKIFNSGNQIDHS